MENASAAFLIAVRKSMRPIRVAIRATTINPDLLTCAERLQYEGYLRREEINAAILALARDGVAIKQIVRKTGHSRQFVRHVLRGVHGDVFRTRQSSLDTYHPAAARRKAQRPTIAEGPFRSNDRAAHDHRA
jgi:transposase